MQIWTPQTFSVAGLFLTGFMKSPPAGTPIEPGDFMIVMGKGQAGHDIAQGIPNSRRPVLNSFSSAGKINTAGKIQACLTWESINAMPLYSSGITLG